MLSEKLHVPSLLQLLLSGLGLLVLIPAAFGLAVFGLVSAASGPLQGQSDSQGALLLAWVVSLVCLLITPSALMALYRLLGKKVPRPNLKYPLRTASLLMLLWPGIMLVGAQLSQATWGWLLLPPLQILAVALPIWWFVELGRFGLPASPGPQRSWGVLSISLLVSPPLIITLEMLLLALVAVFVLFLISSRPELVEQLSGLAQRVVNSQVDYEELLLILRPVFNQPGFIAGLIGVIAGLMPVVEELFKPLPLWFLVSRKMTPAEGFKNGLICGAAFALLESLISISSQNGEWALMAAGRMGTGLLHVITTALVGWGLASAWSNKAYLKLGAAFLISAGLHGIWNIFGILLGISPVAGFPAGSLTGSLSAAAPLALSALSVLLFLLLTGANRILRRDLYDSSESWKTARSENL